MENVLVEIKDLSKSFDKKKTFAVDSLNVDIPKGKIIGLLGPDGAGKTTLIRLMATLLRPTSGYVKILGQDTVSDSEKIFDFIGYMPQKFGLYEDLTVMQNLVLYAKLQGMEKAEERFDTLLEFTNLKKFVNRLAGNLSGGMKQKLGLACTLLRKPKLLLLDEPSVGVDPVSRRELWKMVSELIEDDISVVWSTAYLDEAEKCGEVIILNEGKLLYSGSPQELTFKLKDRAFLVKNITTDRRSVLHKAIQTEGVIDGVISGNSVRVVLQKDFSEIPLDKLNAGENAVLEKVEPRFEDAFMDIVGGVDKAGSPLAKITKEIEKDGGPIVEVKNLTKCYGDFTAASNITFSVKRGEIFGLLGPNGAGKSTTFKMLCGLLTPTKGNAFISGLSLKEVSSQARAKIGYMAQKFSLYNNMTVLQNLSFFAGIYPNSLEKKEIIDLMLKVFNMKGFVNTTSGELPLGFKQRLALSCAIMHHPEVLFLDEPTSGVDPITRREFWSHINAMVSRGVSVIITTHFMDEAEYCDRIALVSSGKILTIGSPDELKASVKTDDNQNPTLEDAFIFLSTQKEDVEK